MVRKKLNIDSELLSEIIVAGMQEKKAEDIIRLDLRDVKGAVTDFFVICTGNSDTQVQAISDSVQDFTRKQIEERVWNSEGYKTGQWILLDYVNVVAHVFLRENRAFYGLEDLWGDAPSKRFEALITINWPKTEKPEKDKKASKAKSTAPKEEKIKKDKKAASEKKVKAEKVVKEKKEKKEKVEKAPKTPKAPKEVKEDKDKKEKKASKSPKK
jgi:ribosome-associated protein